MNTWDCSTTLPYDGQGWNPSEIVVFPFTISLKDEFVDNITNIFENISNSKKEYFGNANINQTRYRRPANQDDDTFLVLNNNGDGVNSAKSYVLDNFDSG